MAKAIFHTPGPVFVGGPGDHQACLSPRQAILRLRLPTRFRVLSETFSSTSSQKRRIADPQSAPMKKLRSQEWFGRQDKMGFLYRSWMKNQGRPPDLFDGRPVIGICNTWSELTPCNGHFRELADFVKRGVWEAGGFPLEFPVMSLGETQLRPTAMLFRNLASMDVEESIRGNPMDGVVLLMGCDKTTPSLLMGAASCDLPTIGLSGGPMLNGKFQGHDIGSGTGVWQMSEKVRSGQMKLEEFFEAESCMHRSKGHCMTMGTASTMASMVEALGMALALADFDTLASHLPCLVNLQPSGTYLMEDFFYAGGLPTVLRELGENGALDRDALTVNGQTIWKNVSEAPCWNREVIHTFAKPFKENSGIAVLRGNLAPDGAIIKLSASSPHLLQHTGRAV